MTIRIPFKAVIFDLDGTLIESIADVHAALQQALSAYHVTIPFSQMRGLVSHGLEPMIEKACILANLTLAAAQKKQIMADYLAYYRHHPTTHTIIFPGVIDCLKNLAAANILLAICSNKPSVTANLVLTHLNLAPFFTCIIGGDDTPRKKPDPQHLHIVLEKLKIAAADAVMIGDAQPDVQAAHGVGMEAVVFCPPEKELALFGTKHYFDHFDQLISVLGTVAITHSATP